jgi:uncharacterized phage infection (PIP) family protein YhgE|tara:strand:+ start:1121 stop:1318 length:198 start_codon:yes stop_codon:yes gene_type:complete
MKPSDYSFTEYLTERLNDEITRVTDVIIDGELKDLNEFYRLRGNIEGLRIALREITDSLNKVVEE